MLVIFNTEYSVYILKVFTEVLCIDERWFFGEILYWKILSYNYLLIRFTMERFAIPKLCNGAWRLWYWVQLWQ